MENNKIQKEEIYDAIKTFLKIIACFCIILVCMQINKKMINSLYDKLPVYSEGFKGESPLECIVAFSEKKYPILSLHKVDDAFWKFVDEGKIKVERVGNNKFIIQ